MTWQLQYPKETKPDMAAISAFIANPLWDELCRFVEETYGLSPKVEYSCCFCSPGWNVKYKKASRALCTLYPDKGYFVCLVSIGAKEAMEAELVLTTCTSYLRTLYSGVKPFNGARWLMVEVTSPDILADVKTLLTVRMKPPKKPDVQA